jgi:hypothetical protein
VSAVPTILQTVSPPVPVDATVQLRFGPVDGNNMNDASASYFAETLGAVLQEIFNEKESPRVDQTEVEITKHIISGRLMSGYSVLANLKVSAVYVFVQSNRKMVDNSEFASEVFDIFSDEDFLNHFIEELQSGTVSGSNFFEDVTAVSVNFLQNANSQETDDTDNGSSQKNIIIIAASACAGAAALIAIGFFAWQRSKR